MVAAWPTLTRILMIMTMAIIIMILQEVTILMIAMMIILITIYGTLGKSKNNGHNRWHSTPV